MHLSVNPRQNQLLAALPPADLERLQADLELIWIATGKVLHESGDRMQHVYFPITAIVSLHYVVESGGSAEVAVIGNEGILGIALFMGGETMPNRAMVLSSGYAYRLKRPALKLAFNRHGGRRSGKFNQVLLRYTQALLTQMAQTAVCNRHHSIYQQLCRWLLLCIDRLPANELMMTQELIANMLGVRREAITEAAGRLKAAGVIEYSRGHITVLERLALEARTCECYAVVRKEYDRLLSQPQPVLEAA
jgi:CRP-like cAMP-binding protein